MLSSPVPVSPFFVICLICGMIFALGGWIFRKYPPKKINNWYGYRTPSSQKSQERWDFAQNYSSKEMIRLGFLFLIISLPGLILPGTYVLMEVFAGVIVLIILTLAMLYRIESAIKKEFSK